MQWTRDRAQTAWAGAQALDQRIEAPLADVVARTGWIRTLGGAEAYLALHARAKGVTVEAVHQAVADRALCVVPAVRGCIYLVPAADVPLAIAIARELSASRNAREMEKTGVSDAELHGVGVAVLAALADQPRSTAQLRKELPPNTIRSLGDAGKQVGVTSTLPPALRRLEFGGRIRRVPIDARLDHERYAWEICDPAPAVPHVHAALAERFFRWAGPATLRAFKDWSGLGVRAARAAMEGLDLQELTIDGVGACLALPSVVDGPAEGPARTVLLPALDNLFGLRDGPEGIVDPRFASVEVSAFGRPPTVPLGAVKIPLERTIAVGARITGLWAWDPAQAAIVTKELEPAGSLDAAVASTGAILDDLGHGRAFCLDSEESLTTRLERVRAARV